MTGSDLGKSLKRTLRGAAGILLAGALASSALTGCGGGTEQTANEQAAAEQSAKQERIVERIMDYVDVMGRHHQMEVLSDIPKNDYLRGGFLFDGQHVRYADAAKYTTRRGVDVSRYQGDIDWEAVKAAGYDFAFLRIGYRGYGQSATLNEDPMFEANYKGARAAGLDVGVYFFAQAIYAEEAIEEAAFVMKILNGRELQLPVVYDPESIPGAQARTDGVSGTQFTLNTQTFCEAVRQAGYEPGVYCNMIWQSEKLDLAKFGDADIWLADYEPQPQSPYAFRFWQYSDTGKVNGISGNVDLNVEMIPVK